MKARKALLFALFILLLSACKADVCPPGSVTYLPDAGLFPAIDSGTAAGASEAPSLVEIGGKTVQVDRVITGPLCNDRWRGTIYVGCEVQVVEWTDEKAPPFFENCSLEIEPGTVVYVAAHNDAAYYNGCSCHTGSEDR